MRLISSLILLVVSDVDAVRDGKCPSYGLPCGLYGTCMYGSKDYQTIFPDSSLPNVPSFTQTSKYGMYCDCGEDFDITGYTGLYCDVQFDKCPGDNNNNICLNGWTCTQDSANPKNSICNCAKTTKGGNKYEGTNCEYIITEWCEGDSGYDISESGNWYCTNNGYCRNGETSPNKMCHCKEGFYGLHCEFTEEKDCTMKCENGGLCKHGVKDYSSLTDDTKIIDLLSKESSYETHCVCPVGFTGLNCQVAVSKSQCGDGNCFYGANCVQDTCDCKSISKEDVQYAGDYCESEIRPRNTTIASESKNQHVAEETVYIFLLAICANVALFFGLVWLHYNRRTVFHAHSSVQVAQDEVAQNTKSTFIDDIGETDDEDKEKFIDDFGEKKKEEEARLEII